MGKGTIAVNWALSRGLKVAQHTPSPHPPSLHLFQIVFKKLGGLLFKPGGSNLQHATTFSFLFLVNAGYLKKTNQQIDCGGNVLASPTRLKEIARSQVDYILGSNPENMSYMVGYGGKYPERIHHRASSLPSVDEYRGHIGCKEGSFYFQTQNPNPNLLSGTLKHLGCGEGGCGVLGRGCGIKSVFGFVGLF
ncbi:endoglucanase 8-like [Cajanus cajan]|uniref:endoglucanase 8-like n=1 Tax=Cajanus cajan TaxID=3821 RepID=UPI0010FB0FB1|nr:endoglucanase 8-like [Cajanus cajan]